MRRAIKLYGRNGRLLVLALRATDGQWEVFSQEGGKMRAVAGILTEDHGTGRSFSLIFFGWALSILTFARGYSYNQDAMDKFSENSA